MVNSSRRLDSIFFALSDPTRRAMVARLSRGPAGVTELARPFAMSLPAASKHLRVLESAGLVSRVRKGRVHEMTLNSKALSEGMAYLKEMQTFWENSLDALATLVENAPKKAKKGKGKTV